MKSIIVPVFNEQENIIALYERLRPVLDSDDEVVFVNDGSTDNSRTILEELAALDARVRVVIFSRNFGHQPAVVAGLHYSTGDAVIVMDCDLQDPPELIPRLVEKWKEGYDVVHCVRRRRKESLPKRLAYWTFYNLYQRMSDIPVQMHSGDFSLMSKRVVKTITAMPEEIKFVRGLRGYAGFKQCALEYDRPARHAGDPKYNLRRLIRLALDGIFSFTTFPLRLMSVSGGITLFMCFVTIVWLVVEKLVWGLAVGTAFTYVLLLFFGGANLLCFGIIGEYIGKIYYETKRRPFFIVEALVNLSPQIPVRTGNE